MSYVHTAGVQKFREVLSEYLNSSRGLQTSFENIMITRGSQMGLYLLTCVLFSKGENVIVGDTNYYYADRCFENAGMHPVIVEGGRVRHRRRCHRKNMQEKENQSNLYHFTPSLSHDGYPIASAESNCWSYQKNLGLLLSKTITL